MTPRWNLLTGEYPPDLGGVSDYSGLLAERLTLEGERVTVWTRARRGETGAHPCVDVRRLRGGFGVRSLPALGRALDGAGGRLLIQYVPQAFGYRGMNLAFCLWLARCRRPVWTMFHEVVFPREAGQPVRHRVLALATQVMARLVARASERVFVSTPAWAPLLSSLAPGAAAAEWLPVPSTIPRADEPDAVSEIRRTYGGHRGPLIGHFGSCGPLIARELERAIPVLLDHVRDASFVLVGGAGAALRRRILDASPSLHLRVWSTGPLQARAVSLHLAACDLMLQPFVDGVTTRRTTVMAALLHGVPTVTSRGRLTEGVWDESRAVAMAPAGDPAALVGVASSLLADGDARARLGAAGLAAYDRFFDLRHTIAGLRRDAREPHGLAVARAS